MFDLERNGGSPGDDYDDSEERPMNELIFLAGLAVGFSIAVPALARICQVDLRRAFERV